MRKFNSVLTAIVVIVSVIRPNLVFGVDAAGKNNLSLFGNDIVAHFDPESFDLTNDIAVAFNGWIYIAYSSAHSNPSGVDIGIAVSKNGGVTWDNFPATISGSHNDASVYDLIVTGTDLNSLRLYLSYSFYDQAFSYSFGHVVVYDGVTGDVLPLGLDIGDGSYNIGEVRLSTDKFHPALGSTGYSVAVAYTTGSGDLTSTDSLVCRIALDDGVGLYNYYLVDSSSTEDISGATIDYGYSSSWTNGLYFIAYKKGNDLAYCRNSLTITSGFSKPLILNGITGLKSGILDSSKIVCQNSVSSNDSDGLSVMIVTKVLDTLGSMTNRIPLVIYNMKAASAEEWKSARIENYSSGYSLVTYDACFSETENRFYFSGYNSDSASLSLRIEDFNFSHPGNWYVVQSQYNDSVIDPSLSPNPKITTDKNYIYASWESRIKGISDLPRSQTLFDRQTLPIITGISHDIASSSFSVYPVPANTILNISLLQSKKTQVKIFNQAGQKIYQRIVYSGDQSIDVSDFVNGIYFLQITDDNDNSISRKILIQHN